MPSQLASSLLAPSATSFAFTHHGHLLVCLMPRFVANQSHRSTRSAATAYKDADVDVTQETRLHCIFSGCTASADSMDTHAALLRYIRYNDAMTMCSENCSQAVALAHSAFLPVRMQVRSKSSGQESTKVFECAYGIGLGPWNQARRVKTRVNVLCDIQAARQGDRVQNKSAANEKSNLRTCLVLFGLFKEGLGWYGERTAERVE